MSYSRFDESSWLCYWICINKPKEEQVFEVQTKDLRRSTLTYENIFSDIESCIARVRDLDLSNLTRREVFSNGKEIDHLIEPVIRKEWEYTELRGYMWEFIDDVNQHFKNLGVA